MMSMRSVVRCTVMFFGGIYMLYRQSPRFAMVAACGLPVIAIFLVFFLRRVSPLFTVIQHRLDQINCIVQENIAGARVVKAYVKEADALENFSKANDSLCAINLRAQTSLAFLNPWRKRGAQPLHRGGAVCGGHFGTSGGRHYAGAGDGCDHLFVPDPYADHFHGQYFSDFYPASASWKRIREVLDTQPAQQPVPPCRRQIERGN